MRRIFTLMIMVLAVLNLLAQAPQKMTYQAVVRNSANVLIANQNVTVRMSILQSSAQGAAVYVEHHAATTNANGLMTVEIGGGSPMTGVFANIDWSAGPYFLKSEIDPEGGINYTIESVQQLLSVPYALYAKEAGNGFSGDYNDLTNVPTFTESQILSISHDTIYLTGGSFVKLPAGFDGDYNSLANKPNLFSGAYNDLTGKPNLATVATSGNYNDLTGKPNLAQVATTGSYSDLTGQPSIPAEQVNADWTATSGKAQILNKPTLFSGSYNDLTNKPTLFDGNYNSLSNKPILFSGNYNDLTNKPTLFDGNYNSLSNRPNLSAVALSGSYNDLINKPALFDGNYNSLSNRPNLAPVATSGSYGDLINKPNLATVATSGSYNDLSNRPAIPAEQVNADWTATAGKAQILNRPNLAPVATSGNYNDLTGKPNLAPVATSGSYSDITGTPNLAPVATSGNYNDLTGKPTIPTVPTNVSAFNNDAGYLTHDSLPTNVSAFTNDAGYLTSFTESQILTISNDTIYLTGGSFVKLPAGFDGDYNSLTNKPNLAPVATSGSYSDISGTPNLAPVATSGNYNDLTGKPTIPTVPTDVSVFNNDAGYLTRDSLPTNVSAFTNDAGYLTSFTESQILSISNDTIYLTGGSFVKLPAGFDGDYNSLTNKPNLFSGAYDDLTGKPNLAPVATSGNYNDLTNKPTIPTVPTDVSVFNNDAGYLTRDSLPTDVSVFNNDAGYLTRDSLPTNVSGFTNDAGYLTSFTESQILSISNDTIYLTGGSFVKLPAGFDGDYNSLTNKPNLFSGAYDDLTGKPNLAPVATSGNYNDLTNKPTIPAEQVNSDWNATSGKAQILNRPNFAPVATTGNYSDLNGRPYLAPVATTGNYNDLNNLPTIPNVPTDVSVFNNDAGYLTRDSLPTNVSAFTNDAGYLTTFTESQILSISNDTIYLTGGSFVKLPAGFDGDYNSLTNRPNLAPVATSGNYSDLNDLPTIPTVPTDVSVFTNDAGYLTADSLANLNNQLENLQHALDSLQQIVENDHFLCGTSTVTDVDGNVYNTVRIGEQCWMKENLRTTRYADGTEIPLGTDTSSIIPYRYNPNNNANKVPAYGYLYNWSAVMNGATSSASNPSGVQGICPTGWHVPSSKEWAQLTYYVGSRSEYVCGGDPIHIAKALSSTNGWRYYNRYGCEIGNNQSSNNATGFSAVPAGGRYGSGFSTSSAYADFWSSTQNNGSNAYAIALNYYNETCASPDGNKSNGFSVRCLHDNTTVDNQLQDVSEQIVSQQSMVNEALLYCPSTVNDIDGNTYNTVQIGEQCWMKENLRTTHYEDGTEILLGMDTSSFTPYRYNPNNDANNVPTYGYLYNWSAVMNGESSSATNPSGVQGICPVGWHVPSDAEWSQLKHYVNGKSEYFCGDNSTAKALASTVGWFTSTSNCAIGNNPSANNATGFGALPAGSYHGHYEGFGLTTTFWPSTQYFDNVIYDWVLTYDFTYLGWGNSYKTTGYSVRCLRDNNSISEQIDAQQSVLDSLAPVAFSGDYNDLVNAPTNVSAFNNDAGYITAADVPAQVNSDWNATSGVEEILNKPTNVSTFTNDAGYLTAQDIPTIPTVPTNVSAFNNDAGYLTSFTESQILSISNDTIYLTGGSFVKLPTAEGFSGSYNDLTNKPVIPTVPTNVSAFTNDAGYLTSFTESQILSISNDTIYLTGGSFVKLPAGFDGDYNSLTNKPNLAPVATSGSYNDITGKPNLAPVATSGNYNDLTNKPTIPTVPTNVSAFANDVGYLTSFTESQILSISNDTIYLTGGSFVKLPAGFDGDYNSLANKPNLAPVATSGNYNDLTGKPTIPTVPTDVSVFNNDAGYITAADVPAQVNSDWNATSGVEEILNKPTNVSAFNNDAGYVTQTQLNTANYVTNSGTDCGNAVDLCSLLSRLDSLEHRLQNMPASINTSAYGVPLNDTCPQRMVMINGSRNACYHGSTEDNVFFIVLVDGSAVYDATYTWYVNGKHINEHNGFLNFYSGMWGPTYNNPYIFTAKVTMADGCSYLSGPFEVNVYDLPDVIVTGSDSVVCEGESVILRAGLRTPGNPMITYQWYENTLSSDNALPGRTHEDETFKPALGTTDYIVIVTHLMEDYGCLSLDTFRVEVAECDTAGGTNNPQTALPTVTTDSVMVISSTSANCYGNVAAEGCTAVTARGVCWSTLHNPTINDSHTADSVGIGSFISILTDLVAGTTYYVRAYATNREGTAYGEETTFTLYLVVPKSGTDNHTMTGNTVTVYDHAGPDANYDNRCWGTLVITAPDSNMLLSISGSYDTYNYYAAQDDHLIIYNGFGTTELIATLRGSGNISNPFFTTQNTVMLRFTSSSYSSTKSGFELFITAIPMNEVPTVTTDTVFNITDSSATCSGNITVNGGVEITAYGVCWGSSHNPTIDGSHTSYSSGTGGFANDITALSANSTYYVRAYATCQHGTIYGNEVSFKTSYGSNGDAQPCQGSHTISDIDGNVYTTVQIGNQCWLAENLRTTRYSDGTPVALGDTLNVVTPYRYAPDFNINYVPEYGYLYNWPAVMHGSSSSISNPSGVQGICPTGWHVPSDSEWTQLTDYLRGPAAYFCNNNNNIAKALTSNTGWHTSIYDCTAGNDMESNNATGFGALPAGHFQGGSYMSFSDEATMWSSSEASNNNVWYRSIASNFAYVRRYSGTKSYGYSVRCLRDIASLSAFPVVTTNTVSEIAEITATCGGSVTSNGAIVTARGVCWSTSPNPTIADSHTTDGNGAGSFTSSLTELLRYNTYYVRAYATTDNGTVYGEEFKFTASIYLNGDEFSCSGTPTVTDVEGNIYNTVQIGGQCWMRENLKTTKYADNTLIEVPIYPHASTTTAYRKSPNGKHSNAPTYGYLYNWRAVMHNSSSSTSNPSGVQGVCPTGWHVPSDAEWTQLTEYVKSQSLYCGNSTFSVAKALAAVQDWYNSTDTCAVGNNPNENNVTGFWALPAGSYYSDDGYYSSSYYSFATDACFWSATEGSSSSAYNRCLYYNDKNINRSNESKCNYFSVRCLRDSASSGNNATTQAALPTITTDSVTAITATTVVCGGDVTAEGSEVVTERGVCWGTAHNPTVCGNHTAEGDGAGHFTVNISGLRTGTTYYVRAYAINNVGTAYGEEVSFKTLRDTVGNGLPCPGIPTVADIDGNIYNTVKFLGKCWMKENLKTTRYADGTFIESGDSFSRETPYRYAPDNDTNNIATYGYLYNWPAVMNGSVSNIASPNGVQGICPNGWHVPNYEELYCIPGPFTESGMCSDENDDAFDDEYYQQVGNYACFWCSEQRDYLEAFFLGITNYASTIGRIKWKSTGMSVRCVLNEEVATILPTVSTITANNLTSTSATCGGNVTSDGGATVTARGVCWSTSQNPTISGNHTTNGSGTGSFTSSLTGLSANTTYYVRAYATNSEGTAYGETVTFTTKATPPVVDEKSCSGTPTVTDYEGNMYATVKIGSQCWMRENLKTTHFADGSLITQGTGRSTTIAYWYYPNNDSSNKETYGLLYNWAAAMHGANSSTANPSGVQGVCPNGWHVPSDAEWTQLINYVSSQSNFRCGNVNTNIAKALAANTMYWNSNDNACAVGNPQSNNNATGFSAVPAGNLVAAGYTSFGDYASFFTATEGSYSSAMVEYHLSSRDSNMVSWNTVMKYNGYSVRCLRD